MEPTYEKRGNLLLPPEAVPARLIFPENGIRARKVVKRSNYGHVIKFPSSKNGRIVELESLLEYDRAVWLEIDPDVVSFHEQPLRIEYADQGKIKRIVPDLLVCRRDGTKTIEEVKPKAKADLPDFQRRVVIEEAVLKKHNYGFRVVTEQEIRLEPFLENAKMLLPHRRPWLDCILRETVLETLDEGGMIGHGLCERINGLTQEDLFAMVAHGCIEADLSLPFGLSSVFTSISSR